MSTFSNFVIFNIFAVLVTSSNAVCYRYIESDSSIIKLATIKTSQGTLNHTECVSICSQNASCYIAATVSTGQCLTVDFGNAKLVERSGLYSGSKVSIKVNVDDDLCDLLDEEILGGLRMQGLNGSAKAARYRYWQVMKRDQKYIVFNHVLTIDHGDCWDLWFEEDQQFCFTFIMGDYNLTTARETCQIFHAHLYGIAFPKNDAWYAALDMRRNSISSGQILLGARRNYTCLGQSTGECKGAKAFQFTDKYVSELHPRKFRFGEGYPIAGKDCYAMQIPDASNATNYEFINVDCDGTDENLVGIACAAPLIRDLPPQY